MSPSPVDATMSAAQVLHVRDSSLPVGKIILGAILLLAVGLSSWLDLSQYLSLEELKANRDRLLAYTHAHYAAAVVAFIIVYCLTAALSVPGDIFLTMVGGFLFGSVIGTLYVNIGATAGATLAFLAARYLLRDWVESKFADGIGPIQEGFQRNAFSYLVTLRLIPAIPFVLVNLVSGLTRMDLGTYVRATALGMLPASFVFAYAGRQLGMIDSVREVASPPVLLALTLLGLLALTPPIYRTLARTLEHRRRRPRVVRQARHTDDL
jgi:uncharacterized membrane protein YdjX (TVP38/TMEM64 family)